MSKDKYNIIRDNPYHVEEGSNTVQGPDFGGYIVVASVRGTNAENLNLTVEGHVKLTDDEKILLELEETMLNDKVGFISKNEFKSVNF